MDELHITSMFLKGVVGKIISSIVKKKFPGYNVKVEIDGFDLTIDDSTARIVLKATGQADKGIIPHIIGTAMKGEKK